MIYLAMAIAAAATSNGSKPVDVQMRSAISQVIADQLTDPDSARFRWPNETASEGVYCGFVNAKNSLGGYIGFRPFYVIGAHGDGPKGDGGFIVSSSLIAGRPTSDYDNMVQKLCLEHGYDLSSLPPDTPAPPFVARRKPAPTHRK